MIWFKAWRELRVRVGMALFVVTVVGAVQLVQSFWDKGGRSAADMTHRSALIGGSGLPSPDAPDFPSQMSWRLYLQLVAFAGPMIGIMLAGSGVTSRPCHGMREEVHPSMLYTLSLPVERWRWLATRAVAGAALTAATVFSMLAIPPLLAPWQHLTIAWSWAFRSAPFLLLGTLLFFVAAVFLEAVGNENWRGGAVAVLLLAMAAEISLGGRLKIFAFLTGYEPSAAGVLLCLVLSAGLYWGAVAALNRREF